jgi:hypothetical protein
MIGLREGLPDVPARMQRLRLDARGYPIPWFVKWFADKPDFRVIDGEKFRQAVRFSQCWICGEPLGSLKTFVVGPSAAINRITSEPANHYECARFAARACPFLILPRARRRENYPEDTKAPPGAHNTGNPGTCALWTSKSVKIIPATDGARLFELQEPINGYLEWFANGRHAVRAEVESALQWALGLTWARFRKMADIHECVDLENAYAKALTYLPA